MENETVAPRLLMTVSAYAKHRGCSRAAVAKARRSGRLRASIVASDAGGYLIDAAVADQEWATNTNQTRTRLAARNTAGVVPPAAGETVDTVTNAPAVSRDTRLGNLPVLSPLAQASADEKQWKAKMAELEFRRMAGELLDREDAEKQWASVLIRIRTAMLAVASKAKGACPDLTLTQVSSLEELIREALATAAGDAGSDG